MPDISVIIPAYNSAAAVAATVTAAKTIPGVTQVIVIDDCSRDDTPQLALAAGGEVLSLPRNQGKGEALRRGLALATGELVLFLDADLGESAALAQALVPPVAQGEANMTIADFVSPEGSGGAAGKGGFGILLGLAGKGISALTGLQLRSPLSGQRCLSRQLAEELGIADRFGVETSLTIEVARWGGRILEIPLALQHARTGRNLAGFRHRARQFRDVLGVLLEAFYGLGKPGMGRFSRGLRLGLWLAAMAALPLLTHFFQPALLPAVWLSLGFSLALVPFLFALLCGSGKYLRENYRGLRLPTAFGLLFVPVWLLSERFWLPLSRVNYSLAAFALMFVWPLLGLFDDLQGSAGARGFRGHIAALLKGRITTGGAKLIIGGLISFVAGWMAAKEQITPALINGLLIALCTNFMNLLDLRPGRALKGFFLLGGTAWIISPQAGLLLAALFSGAVVYFPIDTAERAMLGDVGSNTLGALAGLGLAIALPLPAKIGLALLLAGIHIYAEIGSLSKLIERLAPLRWFDQLGRWEG
jgi:glycosyltransferase involved in cell wall biosynthesis